VLLLSYIASALIHAASAHFKVGFAHRMHDACQTLALLQFPVPIASRGLIPVGKVVTLLSTGQSNATHFREVAIVLVCQYRLIVAHCLSQVVSLCSALLAALEDDRLEQLMQDLLPILEKESAVPLGSDRMGGVRAQRLPGDMPSH
jgi:hypothetical protein